MVPDGWTKEVFTSLVVRPASGKIPKAKKTTYKESGKYPVIDQGQAMVAGYIDDRALLFPGKNPVVVFGDHTRVFKYVDFPFVVGADGTQILRADTNRLDPLFFFYAVSALPLKNLGYSRHFKLLKEQSVSFPSRLSEQRKIAAILSSVDDAIEKTKAVIDQVQVVKKGLMQELLTRGLPGRHKKFKMSEIGEVPEEWEATTLGSTALSEDGLQTGPFGSQLHASDYSAKGVPVVMPKDLSAGRVLEAGVARVPAAKIGHLEKHRVLPGDVLFGRRGDIGRCGMATEAEKGWLCGTGCLRYRPGERVVSRFLIQFLQWRPVTAWLTEHAVGQTMLNLNTKILARLPVTMPPVNEQERIASVLESFDETAQQEDRHQVSLRKVKGALMSVLLTGEVRVTL